MAWQENPEDELEDVIETCRVDLGRGYVDGTLTFDPRTGTPEILQAGSVYYRFTHIILSDSGFDCLSSGESWFRVLRGPNGWIVSVTDGADV